MKKIFCLTILLAVLIVGGCTASKMSIDSTQDEIKISATNADESGGNGNIKIPDGSAVPVDAKISSGKLIIGVGGKEYTVDKSGELFIDVPAGECDLSFTAKEGLIGEIILRALPKV
ncbi:MAG: hypothetical protein IKO74_06330 [Selenomonadaceae bacterium]|nr:hypothetical protein [Selenomonadaceae bacterium]